MGRYWLWRFSRVHDPMSRAGGCFPYIYSQRLWRRDCFEARDNQLGGRVREIVAPDTGVGLGLVKGCA